MPFAQIYILEGRSEDQKRAVIEKVTQALVEALDAPQQNVRVWIHDVPKETGALPELQPRTWAAEGRAGLCRRSEARLPGGDRDR